MLCLPVWKTAQIYHLVYFHMNAKRRFHVRLRNLSPELVTTRLLLIYRSSCPCQNGYIIVSIQ